MRVSSALVWLCLAGSATSIDYSSEALADEVLDLPGAEALVLDFRHFSGYLHLQGEEEASIHMHYWFVESSVIHGNEKDPLVLWTNGGPGCSGLIGKLTELGPFTINADLSLSLNPYSWSSTANMLFVETPCNVGFSYSEIQGDANANDESTADLNYRLIQAFLNRFPHLRENDLYLSSESYGGHYIPMLADTILAENSRPNATVLKLKGFLVGNPYTDHFSAFPSMIETFWGHSLISAPYYSIYQEQCAAIVASGALGRHLSSDESGYSEEQVSACSYFIENMLDQVGAYNPYALDYEQCADSPSNLQRVALLGHVAGRVGLKQRKGERIQDLDNSCAYSYLSQYLNQTTVKRALHVNESIVWSECSRNVNYGRSEASTASLYPKLLNADSDIRILVFSGNDDAVCSTLGTQRWIFNIGLIESSSQVWKPYILRDQVVGYLTHFLDDRIKFFVINGAGHEVPFYKPELSLEMFQKFLKWEWKS